MSTFSDYDEFEEVKYDFRRFGSLVRKLGKEFSYPDKPLDAETRCAIFTKEYYRNNILKKYPDTILKENKLNDLLESVYHTGKRYNLIAFFQEYLPTKYGLTSLLNNEEWELPD